ncbi:uncharacterized protein LOC123529107 [Mercenaria mercenaria]|uniref:uncharacterized protein LOC123529107 n=1 Tax=Mercenaria mercenaria TaxID=6596 RepID=UPI001E1E029C|nr:uncharacterized protein LOC123529107 [Mercenaria mercenaria]
MNNITMNFKVTFRLVDKKSGGVVSYKQDGQRFGQSVTVKLNTDTEYELTVTVRPAVTVKKLMINGGAQTLEHAAGSKADDSDSKTYITQYSTVGYDVSKSGNRKEILLMLEFQNGAYMKTSLQCKLYKAGETSHSHWGQKLSAIDVECKIEEGHNYITVLKEKYL